MLKLEASKVWRGGVGCVQAQILTFGNQTSQWGSISGVWPPSCQLSDTHSRLYPHSPQESLPVPPARDASGHGPKTQSRVQQNAQNTSTVSALTVSTLV